MRAVLTDIEGTTTPLAFVHQVLFPYARRRLGEPWPTDDRRFAAALELLAAEYAAEPAAARPEFGDGRPYALWLMESDRKSTGLKALQGFLWQEGYQSGELQGEVWPDVPAALRRWAARGVRVRIFSSGSILAQKLLFGHSDQGDLLACFEGFHDTTTGPKQAPASYAAIARAFALPPAEILFLSDIVAELDAARHAGLATGLLLRPGNPPAEPNGHRTFASFDQIP